MLTYLSWYDQIINLLFIIGDDTALPILHIIEIKKIPSGQMNLHLLAPFFKVWFLNYNFKLKFDKL